MATVYLALGSNIGDREQNLQEAIRLLRKSGVAVGKISSVYETEPVDYLDQPWFLNAVLEARTGFACRSAPGHPTWHRIADGQQESVRQRASAD